ncbi:purine-nucleoside phosphorylase [Dermabacter vaginalis]|uniref:purine-nucleoside phosphorylase n=1 Tax=Dermabacter vaginalis TaxID=1630135 RepID=UPI0021A49483|nr:purine-nucleoside phosphorylase [Dermabacter vaginalis]MCT2149464.1 purine-nucleoside phosphorylase [Dermabacter vaginalis]
MTDHQHHSSDPYQLAKDAAHALREASGIDHIDIAVTLGSGWSGAADLLGTELFRTSADSIPGFQKPSVKGHVGTLRIIETPSGARVLVLGARTHYYEGRGVSATVHGVRTTAEFGARTLVLTNGCGGLNEQWKPGSPVLITDHINFTGDSPITGATFVDQTDIYTPRLREIAKKVDPSLDEGVYMQFRGPFYETPAEVHMARVLGASLVGMSTVLEAMAAREAGLEVLGFSLVTNLAAGISPTPLNHEEVVEAGRAAAPRLAKLLSDTIHTIAKESDR